ncbi:MAG: hypothetical protein Q8M92_09640, partial [Candidatus Subteraquimicrobiales bacterium]|nr:hypothetical protein [Candidatus Subteraquimicrobiales bacterium]
KYGSTIDEILKFKEKALVELKSLTGGEEQRENLCLKIKDLEKELVDVGQNLSELRKEVALKFEKEVELQLQGLDMPNVRFKVEIRWGSQVETGLLINGGRFRTFPNGLDLVEFLISPNPGEPLKPLAKIASGGEISRIMLALKIILAKVDEIPTLIFDEIDVGIGGKTTVSIGQKLATLGLTHQVICVTHLPQIASFADKHFYVSKIEERGRTIVKVCSLDEKTKISEIARMLAGDLSSVSIEHASELIKSAKEAKKGASSAIA